MNNSLDARAILNVNGKSYIYFSIKAASRFLGKDLTKLPCCIKILLENLLRNEDGENIKFNDIKTLASYIDNKHCNYEINYKPARILMQDFTGIPSIVDLASMRNYIKKNGGDPNKINPSVPVDLIIDHSVIVGNYANTFSFSKNSAQEVKMNLERYQFLKWGESSFTNFRVVPPGKGICHQINIEYLARVVCNNNGIIYPDTLIGTDSHTTMANSLSVLGWGVGGIEAESVMLGQPINMMIPKVIGFKLIGKLPDGVTATDLVLTVTNILRAKGVVGKFVEFYSDGLDYLSVADRATIANMAPEYGATCGFFPIDHKTLDYLSLTGRPKWLIRLIEIYAKEQGLWRSNDLAFFDTLELDLSSVEPVVSGPKRPQDKVFLWQVAESFSSSFLINKSKKTNILQNGSVVIAAITSCANTSNPSLMIAAGLVAQSAVKLGIKSKPWVKTSLAPGSQVVTEYLKKSGLQKNLDALGFNLVGYGCTTCIGNSGPLNENIANYIKNKDLNVVAVLSGNRNFEGRIHPLVKANYLASPPLVVVYALAGTVMIDLTKDPICKDKNGNDIYLKDIWPVKNEIENYINSNVTREMFIQKYKNIFCGDKNWKKIKSKKSEIYNWSIESTYIQNPPYFNNLSLVNNKDNNTININHARILAIFGDSVTTDHISPAGNIAPNSPAGTYLKNLGVPTSDFNSYGSRRGNHNIMIRGTFANIRIKNEMVSNEGGYTKYIPSQETISIFDAAMRYKKEDIPLIIIAGKEYGTGSSRDWAAKGTALLGIKAVVAESFERIHRSNLVGMGVLPLLFQNGLNRKMFDGSEIISMKGKIVPNGDIECVIKKNNNSEQFIKLKCCIQTAIEVKYFMNGGLLNYILMQSLPLKLATKTVND